MSPSGQSHIDLTFTNAFTNEKIENWRAEDVETSSNNSYVTEDLIITDSFTNSQQISSFCVNDILSLFFFDITLKPRVIVMNHKILVKFCDN